MDDHGKKHAEGGDSGLDIEELRRRLNKYELGWPPGHFYSPIPNLNEVAVNENRIFSKEFPDALASIDLSVAYQEEWLGKIESTYPEQPFKNTSSNERRYSFENDYFGYGEALTLFGIMQAVRPKRIFEIGAGFSTAAMLDINELFFDEDISFTVLEPYPDRLLDLLHDGDLYNVDLEQKPVQEISTSKFSELRAGDILFIDSTHVSKIDSDLNHLLFRILPTLRAGVLIHFHDIFYPFEYPESWVYEGRAWNECYILRAFLQYNQAFRVLFFNSFVGYKFADRIANSMPLFAKSPGTSLWLEKIQC